MTRNPIRETTGNRGDFVLRALSGLGVAIALLSLALLGGCNTSSVYLDTFDSTSPGSAPAQPQVGTSTISGNVVVVADPTNTNAADHWLQLTRTAPTATASYIGTLKTPVTAKGGANFVGYVPSSSPIDLSVYFLPAAGPQGAPLLHVDLLPNGNIRLNDSDVVGTYKFDHPVGFFITFDLQASPPTATVLIRGGGQDASKTVPVPPSLAGFGFGKIEVDAPFEGINAKPGKLLINDVIATRAST
ncbi:MAG TPA: hypothetical protein VK699_00725 [Terriglobales bacterium]|jgi:hypothetical protein|nr:hypothetical protein [Terriglobales bacterium]